MPGSSRTMEEALRALGDEAAQPHQAHPDYLDLAAYSEGTLSPAMDEAVQLHLALCIACSDIVLELGEPIEETGEDEQPESPPVEVERRSSTWSTGFLLAAGLAGLGILGLWWFQRAPAHSPTPLTTIAQGTRITHRDSYGAVRADPPPIELTAGEPPSVWGLAPRTPPAHQSYRVHVRDQPGRSIWESSIQPITGPPDQFYLLLDPAFFEAGEYRVDIEGRGRQGPWDELGVWRLVVYGPESPEKPQRE